MTRRLATIGLRTGATLLLAAGLVQAQGGPPLLTDDPFTPGDGRWEINVAFTLERLSSESLFEAPLLDVNYGLGDRIQLKYEVPWVFLDEDGEDLRSGLGNSELGVKYRFLDEERAGVSMSFYPQCSFNNPTSSDERGLVEEGTELALPFQVARGLGLIELGAELGYAVLERAEEEWFGGVAAAWLISERFELVGEVHGEASEDLDEHLLVFNLGSTLVLCDGVNLLFSAGRGLEGSEDEEPELLVYLGCQFVF